MQRSRIYGWLCLILGIMSLANGSLVDPIVWAVLFVCGLYFLHQAARERAESKPITSVKNQITTKVLSPSDLARIREHWNDQFGIKP